jgi:hypothetical protein
MKTIKSRLSACHKCSAFTNTIYQFYSEPLVSTKPLLYGRCVVCTTIVVIPEQTLQELAKNRTKQIDKITVKIPKHLYDSLILASYTHTGNPKNYHLVLMYFIKALISGNCPSYQYRELNDKLDAIRELAICRGADLITLSLQGINLISAFDGIIRSTGIKDRTKLMKCLCAIAYDTLLYKPNYAIIEQIKTICDNAMIAGVIR